MSTLLIILIVYIVGFFIMLGAALVSAREDVWFALFLSFCWPPVVLMYLGALLHGGRTG